MYEGGAFFFGQVPAGGLGNFCATGDIVVFSPCGHAFLDLSSAHRTNCGLDDCQSVDRAVCEPVLCYECSSTLYYRYGYASGQVTCLSGRRGHYPRPVEVNGIF